jgi:hypothetical protein
MAVDYLVKNQDKICYDYISNNPSIFRKSNKNIIRELIL